MLNEYNNWPSKVINILKECTDNVDFFILHLFAYVAKYYSYISTFKRILQIRLLRGAKRSQMCFHGILNFLGRMK